MMIYLGSWLVRLYISLICLKFRRRCTKASCISVILKFPHVLSCLSGQVKKKKKSSEKHLQCAFFTHTGQHSGAQRTVGRLYVQIPLDVILWGERMFSLCLSRHQHRSKVSKAVPVLRTQSNYTSNYLAFDHL